MSNNNNFQQITVKFKNGKEKQISKLFKDEFGSCGIIAFSDETTFEFQAYGGDEHGEFFEKLKKEVVYINFTEFVPLGTGFVWGKR